MKSQTVRFGRSIVLSILFFVTIFSVIGSHIGHEPGLAVVHVSAGSLLLFGASVHLATNWDWIKAVGLRRARRGLVTTPTLSVRVRSLRRTAMWLAISGMLCASSGVMRLVSPGSLQFHGIHELHALSGLTFAIALVVHLIQHRGWFFSTYKRLRRIEGIHPSQTLVKDRA
jgi:hypothetical protein